MAELYPMDEAMRAWIASRPQIIQELAERFPPNKLYRLKTTGLRVTLYSYSEPQEEHSGCLCDQCRGKTKKYDGPTMTVNVTGEFNKVMFDRRVFGVKPEDLEECDLPGEDEEVGTVLEGEEAEEYVKEMIRVARAERN